MLQVCRRTLGGFASVGILERRAQDDCHHAGWLYLNARVQLPQNLFSPKGKIYQGEDMTA